MHQSYKNGEDALSFWTDNASSSIKMANGEARLIYIILAGVKIIVQTSSCSDKIQSLNGNC